VIGSLLSFSDYVCDGQGHFANLTQLVGILVMLIMVIAVFFMPFMAVFLKKWQLKFPY
jgi:hypothetical protein